ncbi:hypothetical protein ACBP93_10250 [Paenalcaligenes hominis]|uniref:Motility protein n=1 Tax=Paenalcaligenes hominis TaxID=643674 RepID=A0ABX0WLI5_9BURK|nr:hypothetical protein [Paenalcaligenes hominis]NJB64107.1 hypothetical protein [Paenalcaligenes hominis]GGE63117.1 hypothetical protein GCM10007278_09310 [Paenalcaligenes hominis]
MSGSVESVVSASIALQGHALAQEKDNLLLKKVLANQEQTIMSLLDAAAVTPKTGPQPLAHSGAVGTQVHVTA